SNPCRCACRMGVVEGRIVNASGDWTSLIEAAHAPMSDDEAWAARIVRATGPPLRPALNLGLIVIEHDAECTSSRAATMVTTGPPPNSAQTPTTLGRDLFRAYYS